VNIVTIIVEPALDSDLACIEDLLDLSFGLSRHTKTSYRLREGNQAVKGLSFVVRDEAIRLSGAISFWPLKVGETGTDALLLGPLAVHPARQNVGIGLALMRHGLARAGGDGHRLILLVGDEPYYARAGFRRVPDRRLMLPGPVDPARFLHLELDEGALESAKGLVLPPHRHSEIFVQRPSRSHMAQMAASSRASATKVADNGISVAARTR
jgi:predicted N-acetyltransferase YhbS